MSTVNYFRSFLLFIFFGISIALPLLWLEPDPYENADSQLMYLRNAAPISLLKRNIAIGRGDGLRPGK